MDSAAIFFSPTSHQTKWLLDQILEQILLSPNTNDMYLLNRISRLNPSKVCLLPTFSSQSIVNSNQQNFDKMSKIKNFDFDGVFDPAAIGVWLTGNDPRNSLGWIKRYKRHFEPSFDPALIKFGFHKKILTGNYLGYEHPIYNLHIHSKQKILFSIYGQLLLKLYVKTSRIGAFKSIYNIFLFRRILNENSVKVEFKPLFLYRVIKILAQSRNSEF
jgi:hypothetical protein